MGQAPLKDTFKQRQEGTEVVLESIEGLNPEP